MEQAIVSADVISPIEECFDRRYLEVERTETEVVEPRPVKVGFL